MRQNQNNSGNRPSDVIIKGLFSGFSNNKVQSDPVHDTRGTISQLEMDNLKNTRSLDQIQKKLDRYDKDRLTTSQKDSIKPLLAERAELKQKIQFNNNSILLMRKSINVHDTTKVTQTVVSNIKNLNIATKELSTQQDVGNVDNIMNDLSELMDDNNDFQDALSTNPLSNQPTTDDLLNEFINEDVVINVKEDPEPLPTQKKPLLINKPKNPEFNQSSYDDNLYKELDSIKVPPSKFKVAVYNKTTTNKNNNNIENHLGWT